MLASRDGTLFGVAPPSPVARQLLDALKQATEHQTDGIRRQLCARQQQLRRSNLVSSTPTLEGPCLASGYFILHQ
jgi:hypothetical protein